MGCTAISKSEGGAISKAKAIYDEFLQQGLNSKIAGIRKKAEEGIENYSFKGASPIGSDKALDMKFTIEHERNGKTLIDGVIDGKHVYYAAESDNPTIIKIKEKRENQREKANTKNLPDNMNTTTTYDRWRKRNNRNFDAWYYGSKKR